MVEAGRYRHGVEGQSQAKVANSEVDDEVLSRFQEVLFLVGDVQQSAVAKQGTYSCRRKTPKPSTRDADVVPRGSGAHVRGNGFRLFSSC